jgi:hypothetical protein
MPEKRDFWETYVENAAILAVFPCTRASISDGVLSCASHANDQEKLETRKWQAKHLGKRWSKEFLAP